MASQFYSKGHYRSVSPKEDTPAQVAQRVADEKERQQIHAEARMLYPLTAETMAMNFWQYQKYVDDECWKRIFSKYKKH